MKSSLVIVSAPTNPSCWAQADSSTSHTTLSSISHNLRRKEPTKSKGTRALFFGQEQLHKLQWLLERFLGKEGLPTFPSLLERLFVLDGLHIHQSLLVKSFALEGLPKHHHLPQLLALDGFHT
ncbi:hypothetical protein PCANC_21162 [Puccinia coronata f. sp. avenae]|uniref:Uncharacterized protein n=1 Tax=Puccinia coronata f. sp. avenae TaxID=200324 RepID=A0A2N5SSW8_9BASI|nr:hypothetical protein PCANC_21162 [Puccinia coronata f. sp. avenae]